MKWLSVAGAIVEKTKGVWLYPSTTRGLGVQGELLSVAARSVWGKSDRDTGESMPLHRHMSDAAAVAGLLWDRWLPRSVCRLLGRDRPEGQARALVVWMAAVHDLGKASPAFGVQVEGLADRMNRCGLAVPASIPPAERRCAPHSVASHVLLRRWLVEDMQFHPSVADSYAIVPGGHHGVTPSSQAIRVADRAHLLGTERWVVVQRELAEFAADVSGAREYFPQWRARPLPPPAQVLLTATVIVADWIASDSTLFPYVDERSSASRAAAAWRDIGLTSPWQPCDVPRVEELFQCRFDLPVDAVLRPVQLAAVELAARIADPGLFIIEAPMGEGKTELALAAAEVLAGRVGAGGCFVALPTMATSDAMFARVLRWMEHLDGTGANSTFLAHGKAALNADFQNLLFRGRPVGVEQDNLSDERRGLQTEPVAVALQWLAGRKKGVLSNFVVGTIDQVLVGALKSRHLVLRHLALAGKIVVIDEVHAADDYMSVYLDQILLWLGAYQVPTIVLSATLPSARRRTMVAAYDRGRRSDSPVLVPPEAFTFRPRRVDGASLSLQDSSEKYLSVLDGDIGYPVITASTGGAPEIVVAESSGRSLTVALERAEDDDETLLNLLSQALVDGGCVGIVRNTVRRAQETARLLRGHYGADVFLVHSRFLAVDRIAREAELRAWLGPESGAVPRPGRKIVVGTQVLEQSLDIDFDLLITDFAPMDLILQRLGRLHRHSRPAAARPGRLRRARCVVVGVQQWQAEPPVPISASKYVYSGALLLRTFAVLEDLWTAGGTITLTLPAQIAPLVQRTYDPGLVSPLSWGEALTVAQLEHDVTVARRRREAQNFLLGPVGAFGSTVFDWNGKGVGDAEDGVQGQAQVRDGDEAVEVVIVQRVGADFFVPEWVRPCGGRQLAHNGEPDRAVAKAAATCTLRLPGWMSTPGYIFRLVDALEANGKASWQQSPWLKGQLVLVLDENLRTELLGAEIRYDRDEGLVVVTTGKATP